MTTTKHTTDYLIVGSGAIGMAFADVLLAETDANLIIVDSYAKPGGHWNAAYPFVTLHQPSMFYGVSSLELGKNRKDKIGWNQGLNDLATGAEVSAYYEEVMRHHFLPSGRVQYFPLHDYQGDGVFASKLTGKRHEVSVARKTVDATYLKTTVPSLHTPNFSVADGVQFMPLNNLPRVESPPTGYIVIGGGKTGIDACLWLLENDVDPNNIQWIVSRDAWLLDRKNAQPTEEFFVDAIGAQASQMEALAKAESIEDVFDRLEQSGYFLRIDTNTRPSMFHGATISQKELEQMRRIKNVIRLGHVQAINENEIVLERGSIPTSAQHLHIDCSASAVGNLETTPIFAGDLIIPQTVRSYQPAFSAAFIAHIEAIHDDEATKNKLCGVVPLPNHDTDYIRFTLAFMMNQYLWSQDKELREWLRTNRLDGFSQMVANVKEGEAEKLAILGRIRQHTPAAMAKLQQFNAELAARG